MRKRSLAIGIAVLAVASVAVAQQLTLFDEGVNKGGNIGYIDCVGDGITCARSGRKATVTVNAIGGDGGVHNLLSATHPDTSAASPTANTFIVGNGTAWEQTSALGTCVGAGKAVQYDSIGHDFSCLAGTYAAAGACAADTYVIETTTSGVTCSTALANCASAGNALNYNTSTDAWSCRTGLAAAAVCSADQYVTGTTTSGVSCSNTISNCNAAGEALNYNTTTDAWTCRAGLAAAAACGAGTVAKATTTSGTTCSAVALGSEVSGTLPIAHGGIGTTSLACAGSQWATSDGAQLYCLQPGIADLANWPTCSAAQRLTAAGSTPTCSSVAHSILNATYHSDVTGSGSEAPGDLFYRNGSSQWTRLALGGTGTVLHGGASSPGYSAVSMSADVTGTLPIANGGTGANSLSCTASQALTANGSAVSCGTVAANAFPYGEAYYQGGSSNVTLTTAGTYYGATMLGTGEVGNGVTYNNDDSNGDYLDVGAGGAGTYLLTATAQGDGSVYGTFWFAKIYADAAAACGTYAIQTYGAADSTLMTFQAQCVKTLTASQKLRVKFAADTSSRTLTVHQVSLIAHRIY